MDIEKRLKQTIRKLSKSPIGIIFFPIFGAVNHGLYRFFRVRWFLSGKKKPSQDEVRLMCENVTFIYKSFERQRMAKRLFYNIQDYYPGVRVIIADDSSKPLEIKHNNATVLQLPFNSGLSYGLNRALEKVETPFVIRLDDDELLTPFSRFHDQLRFLQQHNEVDLAAVPYFSVPRCASSEIEASLFYKYTMRNAKKPLIIPHMTWIDDNHVVVGKAPNAFVARTEKLRMIGYDDHIRMIDHHDFFYRAAGIIVSVVDPTASVFHYHNIFDKHYEKFRGDYQGDRNYIMNRKK